MSGVTTDTSRQTFRSNPPSLPSPPFPPFPLSSHTLSVSFSSGNTEASPLPLRCLIIGTRIPFETDQESINGATKRPRKIKERDAVLARDQRNKGFFPLSTPTLLLPPPPSEYRRDGGFKRSGSVISSRLYAATRQRVYLPDLYSIGNRFPGTR